MAGINFRRIFHPVGQGAFFTEQLLSRQNGEVLFNVVYDCGSKTTGIRPKMEKEIDNMYADNKQTKPIMKKKLTLLFLICFLSALNINATVYSGSCGTNVRYSLDTRTGVLKITGTGAMKDYSSYSSVPWYSYRSYIKSVEISNSVTSIGNNAFRYCYGLTSITIPNSVTSIGYDAFVSCSGLTSIIIGNSVTGIGDNAFDGCSGLTSVHITDIAAWCKIKFSSNPLYYAHHLFMDGKEITDLVIPNSVTSIRQGAFNCKNLATVVSLIEKPFEIFGIVWGTLGSFSQETFNNATLYVPKGTIEKYKATEGWKDFKNIVERTPTGITSVTSDKENPNAPIYDLNGRRLTEPQKGINIICGKKILIH